jgi:hypothetical protein
MGTSTPNQPEMLGGAGQLRAGPGNPAATPKCSCQSEQRYRKWELGLLPGWPAWFETSGKFEIASSLLARYG